MVGEAITCLPHITSTQSTKDMNERTIDAASQTEVSTLPSLIFLAIMVVMIAAVWKVFTKAGKAGWLSLVPIANVYTLIKIAGRPGWWLVLLLVPLINVVIAILVALDLAKAFGKGAGFALGLVFLGPVFYPILGFGSATYTRPPNA